MTGGHYVVFMPVTRRHRLLDSQDGMTNRNGEVHILLNSQRWTYSVASV